MENIINKRNIYSFDLTKYFDSINLQSIVDSLNDHFGVPKNISNFLGRIHQSLPSNMKKNLNDDPLRPNIYNNLLNRIANKDYEDLSQKKSESGEKKEPG